MASSNRRKTGQKKATASAREKSREREREREREQERAGNTLAAVRAAYLSFCTRTGMVYIDYIDYRDSLPQDATNPAHVGTQVLAARTQRARWSPQYIYIYIYIYI